MKLIDISNIEHNRKSVYYYIASRYNENSEIGSNGTDINSAETILSYYDIDAADNSIFKLADDNLTIRLV